MAGIFLALALSGCGGGGGGGGTSSTTNRVNNVALLGRPISVVAGQPWHAQYINGQRVVCGAFSAGPGVYINDTFKAMPQTIAGGSQYVPVYMAGKIVYGTYSGGNFAWNMSTNAVADTGAKQAVAVSPDGDYVAFQTAGTGSVLHVATNTEVALPFAQISAVSDSGSGVCVTSTSSGSYRFTAAGNISRSPLTGTGGSQSFTIAAANSNGLLTGVSGGLPAIWTAGSDKPTALGIPGGSSGYAETLSDGGAAGGWYQPSPSSGDYALMWPEGPSSPNVFVDINSQFPLAGGAILSGIYVVDPTNLNFIGLVTNSDGSLAIQAFKVN